jgi:pilus assembly protein CpaC
MTGGSTSVIARYCRTGAAFLILIYMMSAGVTAQAQPPEITLSPGPSKYAGEIAVAIYKSQILRSDSKIERILVGNPKIADVVPLTDHTFYVLGKALGGTNITVYGPNKSLVAVADVNVTYDTEELKRRLHELLPSENVEIRPAGDAVVLSGAVSDGDKLSRAISLAGYYAPGKVSSAGPASRALRRGAAQRPAGTRHQPLRVVQGLGRSGA